MSDPMDYYEEFGADMMGLSVADNDDESGLVGLIQVQADRHLACAHLTPKEMRNLASELIKLSVAIEKEKKKGAK